MKYEFYLKTTQKISKNTNLCRAIVGFNKTVTVLIYMFYPCLLGFLLYSQSQLFWKVFIVPAVSFVILSAVRYLLNFARPYEIIEGLQPLYNKKTVGKSFPSRHTFSGFIIGTVTLFVNVYVGALILILSGLLAICRVLSGVHFIRDVVVGALIGIVFGTLGMLLL